MPHLTKIGTACYKDGRRITREEFEDLREAHEAPTLESMRAEVEAAPNFPAMELCLQCGEEFAPRRWRHVAGERGQVALCPRCGQAAECGLIRFGEEV
jgi:hypothetical protein